MSTKIVVITGMNKHDLDKKQWDWRSAHPKAVVLKVHPDEQLPLKMTHVRRGEKRPPADDQVSRGIDYED